jgi:hypothetical protein
VKKEKRLIFKVHKDQLLNKNFQRVIMKEAKKMDLEMVLVLFTINKVVDTKVIGMIIKCKDMVFYIILMEEKPIKVNGLMILFMEKVFFLTKILPQCQHIHMSINLLINANYNSIGLAMTDGFKMIKNLAMANYY